MAANRHTQHAAWTAVALVLCVAAAGGCTSPARDAPAPAAMPAPADAPPNPDAGLPVSNGPSGPKHGVPDTVRAVDNGDGGTTDKLAANAVTDIETYWTQAFPRSFGGKQFGPVKRLVSFDSTAPGRPLCGLSTAGTVNAFYCPSDDSIAWDRGELLPSLQRSFGPIAVVTVLAHEMGHAVQRRAGTVHDNDPVIVLEQQADCFAGAFFRHVAEGRAEHFQLSTGDGLNRVMGVLNYIRDAPGRTNFTDENAHGSAFDRVTAFQYGYSDGPGRCGGMDLHDVTKRTTQFQFWKSSQESDLPVDDKRIEAVRTSLNEVFRGMGAAPPTIITTQQRCPSTKTTSPAAYCPDTNTVSLAMRELQRIAQPPTRGGQATGYGDFAAYAQVASRYVLAVQKAAGLPLSGAAAGLRTACLVGAWSGLLVEDPIGQRNPVGKLRIAPGDVDEGVAALLGEDSLIAADVNGSQVPAGFSRLEAFRIGFQEGNISCGAKYRG